MLLLALACTPDGSTDTAQHTPTLTDLRQVVPGDGLPSEITPQDSNNNLDIVRHDGRLWLAFRTAPSHFASSETELFVVSTEDEETWRYEGRFAMDTDLREPRFLSHDGDLFLYFAILGDNPLAFEPGSSRVTRYLSTGEWTEPETWFDEEGFIPWRVRQWNGRPTMIGYTGGENIYENDGEGVKVYWLQSDDGLTWEALVPGQPVVTEGGSSETDWASLSDGTVIAVQRNEAGDEMGWGSRICRAEANALGDWTCTADPRKYDSPLVFAHEDHIYLIGRRNVTETGAYDLGMDDLSAASQTLMYQADYWQHPKRCSLWEVDPEALVVEFLMDLPSRGDTCFPSAIDQGDGSFLVYNYTSPLDGEDVSWLEGQQGQTIIYRAMLHF